MTTETATTTTGYAVTLRLHKNLWWAETNVDGQPFVIAATSRDEAVIRVENRIEAWLAAKPTERINGEIK